MRHAQRSAGNVKGKHMTTATHIYIVRGRSIDGTIYACEHGMWCDSRRDAKRYMTEAQAQARIDAQRKINARSDADSIIGHLTIITI